MSNLEYVQELCGTEQVGWVCEQLAKELDRRDERISELEGFLKKLGYCTCHGVWNCPDEQEDRDE